MKKILILFLIILLTGTITVSAQESYVLKAKISMINSVPKQFFGTWSVKSSLVSTDNPKTFATNSLDTWNLRRSGNVIELRNPVTAAVAEIYLDDVNDNEITFTHYEKEENTTIKDSVTLLLNGNTFTGTNEIILTTVRYDEYHRRKVTEIKSAIYEIKGSKLTGTGVFEGIYGQ